VQVNEVHRPGEPGDPVGDPQLYVGGPLFLLGQDDRITLELNWQLDGPELA
jgi:hypothetical protein